MTDRILHGLHIKFNKTSAISGVVKVIRPDGTLLINLAVNYAHGLVWHAQVENNIIGRTIIKVPTACEIEINPPLNWDDFDAL